MSNPLPNSPFRRPPMEGPVCGGPTTVQGDLRKAVAGQGPHRRSGWRKANGRPQIWTRQSESAPGTVGFHIPPSLSHPWHTDPPPPPPPLCLSSPHPTPCCKQPYPPITSLLVCSDLRVPFNQPSRIASVRPAGEEGLRDLLGGPDACERPLHPTVSQGVQCTHGQRGILQDGGIASPDPHAVNAAFAWALHTGTDGPHWGTLGGCG